MRRPEPGSVIVTFAAEPTGSRDTPSSFDVWILTDGAQHCLPLTDGAGSVEVPDTSTLDAFQVVVVSHPLETPLRRDLRYALTLAEGEPPPPVDTGDPPVIATPTDDADEGAGGCNCGTSGHAAAAWLALAGLAISVRRRATHSANRRRA